MAAMVRYQVIPCSGVAIELIVTTFCTITEFYIIVSCDRLVWFSLFYQIAAGMANVTLWAWI